MLTGDLIMFLSVLVAKFAVKLAVFPGVQALLVRPSVLFIELIVNIAVLVG